MGAFKPVPSALQAVPFQWATYRAGTLPAWEKLPPAYKLLLLPMANAETKPFRPVPNALQVVPFHRATLEANTVPTAVKAPPMNRLVPDCTTLYTGPSAPLDIPEPACQRSSPAPAAPAGRNTGRPSGAVRIRKVRASNEPVIPGFSVPSGLRASDREGGHGRARGKTGSSSGRATQAQYQQQQMQ